MKNLFVLAVSMSFCVSAFAAQSIECTVVGKNADNLKTELNLTANIGHGGSKLASNIDILVNNSEEVAVSLSPKVVSKFRNNDHLLVIEVKDYVAKRKALALKYNRETNKGTIEYNIDGISIKTNNIECSEI
jgi:hypothetical protein